MISLPAAPPSSLGHAYIEAAAHALANASSAGEPPRLCEVNPPLFGDPMALGRAISRRMQVRSYTIVVCGGDNGAPQARSRNVRVLDGGLPCSIRGAGLEAQLSDCECQPTNHAGQRAPTCRLLF